MAITTRSAFTYGHKITSDNENIDFTEDGATELTATIEIGSYYLNEFADAIAVALNTIGDNAYTVTLDRVTRKFTIAADSTFDLLVTTGSTTAISAFSLMGFTSNKTGGSSYESDVASGSVYYPQAPLRDFIDFDDVQESVQAKVNESSSGEIEVVSYGTRYLMECNIKYATDINVSASDYIENNATGVSDLREFLQYIVGKNPIEFIADKTDFTTFESCLLESTQRSGDGTGFQLRELYSEGLAFYFESGKLVFRRLN